MTKKLLLCLSTALVLSGCQTTMNDVRSGFSDVGNRISNLFSSEETRLAGGPCPTFTISEDLNSYYEIPKTFRKDEDVGFSNAVMEKIGGVCQIDEESDTVTAQIEIDLKAMPGPFVAQSVKPQVLKIPYFVAIVDRDQEILSKNNFIIPMELSGVQNEIFHKEEVQKKLPIKAGDNLGRYTVIAGFQLSEPQLAYAKNQKKLAETMPAAGETPIIGADPFAGQ